MAERRIKGTHIPRIALACVALVLFFIALGFKLVRVPIDFTTPFWAFVMVGFLFLGIMMLVTSWIIGLDTRAEIFITLFMMTLHIGFDAFIFVQVFIFARDIPVALVQGVVQAYWIAGLLDVVLMYWASNWERTASDYISPAQQIEAMSREMALKDAALTQAQREAARATQEAQRAYEDAHRTYIASCQVCGKVYEKPTQAQANAAVDGHRPKCKGRPVAQISSNGHRESTRVEG